MDKRFDDVLDECIDLIVVEGRAVEECLARYPQWAAQLEPLVRLAQSMADACRFEARPDFKAQVRYRLQAFLAAAPPTRRWRWRLWAGLAMPLVALIVGASAVAASGNSLPDEPLYGVKLATEEVRLALTPDRVARARFHLLFADRRVQEMAMVARQGHPRAVERLAQRLSQHLAMVERAAHEGPVDDLKPILDRGALRHGALLEAVLNQAPDSARPALRVALERYRQGYQRAAEAMEGLPSGQPRLLPRSGEWVPSPEPRGRLN